MKTRLIPILLFVTLAATVALAGVLRQPSWWSKVRKQRCKYVVSGFSNASGYNGEYKGRPGQSGFEGLSLDPVYTNQNNDAATTFTLAYSDDYNMWVLMVDIQSEPGVTTDYHINGNDPENCCWTNDVGNPSAIGTVKMCP